jgi:hypothetical protein
MARFERPLHEMTRIAAESDVPVRKIPDGETGLKKTREGLSPAILSKGKAGRPRKDGERYPSGKLKPSSEISPAHWQRIRTDAIKLGGDARLGSELSRLSLFGYLTSAQTAAGFRMAEIYGRYERSRGLRRAAKSAAYDIGHGDPDLDEERMTTDELDRLAERQAKARKDFADLQQELPVYPPRARALLEALVLEDRPLDVGTLRDIAPLLDRLVMYFGDKWRNRKPGPGKAERKRPVAVADMAMAGPREQPLEPPAKTAFKMAIARLRPDLDEAAIEQAYKLQSELASAVAERTRFRTDKERAKSTPLTKRAALP